MQPDSGLFLWNIYLQKEREAKFCCISEAEEIRTPPHFHTKAEPALPAACPGASCCAGAGPVPASPVTLLKAAE